MTLFKLSYIVLRQFWEISIVTNTEGAKQHETILNCTETGKLNRCCQNICSTISWKAASHEVPECSTVQTQRRPSLVVYLHHGLQRQ